MQIIIVIVIGIIIIIASIVINILILRDEKLENDKKVALNLLLIKLENEKKINDELIKENKRIADFRPPLLAGQTCSSNISNGICTDIIGANGYKTTLRPDGDLAIYNANKIPALKWTGNTGGSVNAIWKVSTDGRIIVVNSLGKETWQSNEANLGIKPYYAAMTGCNLQLFDSTDKAIYSDPNGC